MKKTRCSWCNTNNANYVEYHDHEWGILNFEEKYLYEMLILESFQAGLSWECVLNKRESFRKAYDDFDLDAVCSYGCDKISELMGNRELIRNRGKIEASIENSKIFKKIGLEFGSFHSYLRSFTGDEIYYEIDCTHNSLSDAISEDLKARGMKYVGTTVIYSYLQAIGRIQSHEKQCFLYRSAFSDGPCGK